MSLASIYGSLDSVLDHGLDRGPAHAQVYSPKSRFALASFPGLPRFRSTEAEERSSASMYYTERKPKTKKRGRPRNEASFAPLSPSMMMSWI